jgi:hypothetical protein
MPTEARWLIRTALLYLVLGLGLGVVRAGQGAGALPGSPATLWLPQLHALPVGWITQLIFGVAFWLFPRPTSGEQGTLVVWIAYGSLNAGLVLRLVGEPVSTLGAVRAWLLVAAAALQWGASLLLVGYFWRSVDTK